MMVTEETLNLHQVPSRDGRSRKRIQKSQYDIHYIRPLMMGLMQGSLERSYLVEAGAQFREITLGVMRSHDAY